MLKRSFIHIPGIGYKTENYIWENGIYSWNEFLTKCNYLDLSAKKIEKITKYLILSNRHLERGNIHFFTKTLPLSEFWRLYPEFKHKVVFLDIETTGLSPYYNEITIIGTFNGKSIKTYIAGKNLNSFVKDVAKYSLMVTYNGTCFDIPFIKTKFRSFISPPHIDLRYFLKRLGYSGGLKAIEEKLGIKRPGGIKDIDGFYATILWDKYTRGDIGALNLLVDYNNADIINLHILMEKSYKIMHNSLRSEYKMPPIEAELVKGFALTLLKERKDINLNEFRSELNRKFPHLFINENCGGKLNEDADLINEFILIISLLEEVKTFLCTNSRCYDTTLVLDKAVFVKKNICNKCGHKKKLISKKKLLEKINSPNTTILPHIRRGFRK